MSKPITLAWALFLCLCSPATQALSFGGESSCGPLANGYGPFDYRSQRRALGVVHSHHFNQDVQQLRRGQEGSIAGDLDYVLRASPNHHMALDAIVRLWVKQKGSESGFLKPLDCYLDRALRFAPDDPIPPLLFAAHFAKIQRKKDALNLVDFALRSPKAWAFTHFNAGLVLVELGETQRALEQAHLAMAQGMNRPELRNALEKQGQWRDPAPAPAPAAASASAPASGPAPASAAASVASAP